MDNLELFNKVKSVPDNAKKQIKGGRLKGMTDINPMWRIATLTEQFGVCGFGWKVEIVKTWLDQAGNEIVANVQINLYIKMDDTWSEPIVGIGGSKLIAKENSGLYNDDECYKKAYTDAISVACKALGVGADVYWNEKSKYDTKDDQSRGKPFDGVERPKNERKMSKWVQVHDLIKNADIELASVKEWIIRSFGKDIPINNLTDEQFEKLMTALNKCIDEANADE